MIATIAPYVIILSRYAQNYIVHTLTQLIDADPHFKRVVGYMRPSDYGVIGLATAALPAGICFAEWLDPVKGKFARPSVKFLRVATMLGFAVGFGAAYARSSLRFFGVTENAREYKKDEAQMAARKAAGLEPYGTSSLTPELQEIAAKNSAHSIAGLFIFPWFNFVNHPYHGREQK